MHLESLIANQGSISILRDCLSKLYQINFFAALSEVGKRRNQPVATTSPIEHNALRAAFGDGYETAVNDIFYFIQRFATQKDQSQKTPMNFGALETLRQLGDITEQEYESLYGNATAASKSRTGS